MIKQYLKIRLSILQNEILNINPKTTTPESVYINVMAYNKLKSELLNLIALIDSNELDEYIQQNKQNGDNENE